MRVSYWTTACLDPRIEAVAKELEDLRTRFGAGRTVALSEHLTRSICWSRAGMGLHPRFQNALRALLPLLGDRGADARDGAAPGGGGSRCREDQADLSRHRPRALRAAVRCGGGAVASRAVRHLSARAGGNSRPWRSGGTALAAVKDELARRPRAKVVLHEGVHAVMSGFYHRNAFTVIPYMSAAGGKECPRSLLESLACGVPALVSRCAPFAGGGHRPTRARHGQPHLAREAPGRRVPRRPALCRRGRWPGRVLDARAARPVSHRTPRARRGELIPQDGGRVLTACTIGAPVPGDIR